MTPKSSKQCNCTCHTDKYFDEPHIKSCLPDNPNPNHPYTHTQSSKHINIDGIENALEGIWGELEKLNKRLSPYYEGKCDDCGEKVLLLKESYKEQINLGWYHALQVFHGSVQNPAFGDTGDLCNGIIEIGEEDL